MSTELINTAISKGAKLHASISGGKDGQAMVKSLLENGYDIASLIHADLGSVEWPESIVMCRKLSAYYDIPLHVVKRSDGLGLLEYWKRRMLKLLGTGIPFWSSADNRYCTSDTKRGPIDVLFTTLDNFIISCEGVRADESAARGKKQPVTIRRTKTSSFYDGMTVEEAVTAYDPRYRLTLTWYPIFNFSLSDVWATFNMSGAALNQARAEYKSTASVPAWWPFHPAYAYGNDRVSCMFCVLGSMNDLRVAAEHNPALLEEMISMEIEGAATFKNKWSLKQLLIGKP